MLLGVGWFLVLHATGHAPAAGPVTGSLITAAALAAAAVTIYLHPRLAGWWLRRSGGRTEAFYAWVLVVDTALICVLVYVTGGYMSIAYTLFYFFAIGNCYMFSPRQMLVADTFMGASYVVTLALMPAGPGAPALSNWVDIAVLRVPLIYVVSFYARWLARRGDRLQHETEGQYAETLRGFLNALEARDGYTKQHSVNVARWSCAFARHLGLDVGECATLRHAAELHDIGKIGVPDAILNKADRLTPAEMATMREHPLIGVRIAQPLRWFRRRHLAIVRSHHERWDGLGYPDGLAGEAIPRLARVLAVCDAFDAMTNRRPYRPPRSYSEAMRAIRDGAGTQFDPGVAAGFLDFLAQMLDAIERHAGDFLDAREGTWEDDYLSIALITGAGERTVYLTYGDAGWEWVPKSIVAAHREAAAASRPDEDGG